MRPFVRFSASRPRSSFRPRVEQLEARDVPSAGSLDPRFNDIGHRELAFLGATDAEAAAAVAVRPDGKIVAVGTFNFNGGAISNFAVARFNNNGSLDTSFGNGGRVTIDTPGANEQATCVALQDDGKIVVGGWANIAGDDDFVVARLKPDGSPDTSFNATGQRSFNFNGGAGTDNDQCFGVAIQTIAGARKIVLVGSVDVGGIQGINFGVLRLNDSGATDIFFTRTLGGTDIARAVAIDGANRIVVAGYTNAFGANDFGVRRFNTDGMDDNTFGGGGVQLANFGDDDQAFAVAIQADGKIVVAGSTGNAGSPDFAVARFTDTTGLDTNTFGGGDGLVNVTFGGVDNATGVAIQADGKIVVAGFTDQGPAPGNNFAVLRLTSAGTLDTTFNDIASPVLSNGDGKASYDFGGDDRANGIALDKHGRIVLAGLTTSGGVKHFRIARLGDTPIFASLVKVKKGLTFVLKVRISFADTAELKREFVSPFQTPKYTQIKVVAVDVNGDGVTDGVMVTAKLGKKLRTRIFVA